MSAYRARVPSPSRPPATTRRFAPFLGARAAGVLGLLPTLAVANPSLPGDHPSESATEVPSRPSAEATNPLLISTSLSMASSWDTLTVVLWRALRWPAPKSDEGGSNEGDTPPGG